MTSGPRAGEGSGRPRGQAARPISLPAPRGAPTRCGLPSIGRWNHLKNPSGIGIGDWEPCPPRTSLLPVISGTLLSTHTHLLTSSAYVGTPGWLGYQGDGKES